MKFTTTTALTTTAIIATASAATAPSLTATYQLRVTGSDNPRINSSFLTVKNPSAWTEPNALGVWSTGEPRYPYQFTFAKAKTDPRFYELNGALRTTHLFVYGIDSIKGLFDGAIGANVELKNDPTYFDDKWVTLNTAGFFTLRHGQDFKTAANATGGAGTWRACRGDSEVDYQMYWYDGGSPLQIKNCESVLLALVESTPQASVSPSVTPTGATNPTRTGASTKTIGLPSPTHSWNGTSSPSPTQFQGAGSQLKALGGMAAVVLGAMAIFV